MKRAVILIVALAMMPGALVHADTPKQAFDSFVTAIKISDGEKSWELLSSASQDSFNQLYAMLAEMMDVSGEGMEEMAGVTSGKTLWIKAISESGNSGMNMTTELDNMIVTKEEVSGNKATLTVKSGTSVEKIDFIKENGAWKMDMSEALSPLTGAGSSCPAPIEKDAGSK